MSGVIPTIEKQIENFVAGSASEYAFPAELSAEKRKLVKMTAEKFGLATKSFGMGSDRQIHIFKPALSTKPELQTIEYSVKNTFVDGPVESQSSPVGPAHQSMPVGGLQAHLVAEEIATPTDRSNLLEKLGSTQSKAEEEPRESQSSGSTADSESETAQDPTVSIKNSFVHFEGDSEESGDPRITQSMPNGKFAETIEAEKAVKQKGRPLPFSENPEQEAERTCTMEFPSTPNAEMTCGPEHGQMFPAVNSVPATTIPQDSFVTILPPACWTPAAPSQTPVTPLEAMVASQESSVTILPPACWTLKPPVQNDGSLAQQGHFQGLPEGSPPQQSTSTAPQPLPGLIEGLPGMPSQGPPPQPQFMPGTPVMLCGLASQPAFNGLYGTVSSFDPDSSRYNILVDTGTNVNRRMVKVKFQNLRLAQTSLPPQPPILPPHVPPPLPYYPYGAQPGYPHGSQCPQPPKATLTLDAMI